MPYFIALLTVLSAAVCHAQDEPKIISSRDVYGKPTSVDNSKSLRVQAHLSCNGRLELGAAEFSQPNGFQTVRVPVHSLSDMPVKFVVETAFIKSDGSVVRSPYPTQIGGFEGMTRGFVGLVSLGVSEARMQQSAKSTIITRHQLTPGESVIVEHQLPYETSEVVGSRSIVAIDSTKSEMAHENTVRRSLDEQYWDVREKYHDARKAENALWDQLRLQLQQEKQGHKPLSEGYREAMDRYWEEHRAHLKRIEEIELKFSQFEKDQKQRLSDQLRP